MERALGIYVFMGLVIGGVLGVGFGAAIQNPILGIALGALGGVFIGWFVARGKGFQSDSLQPFQVASPQSTLQESLAQSTNCQATLKQLPYAKKEGSKLKFGHLQPGICQDE
jgi:hypothetical protein